MRVPVADDAVLFGRRLADVLASLPRAESAGGAANGKIALQEAGMLTTDLLTLDIEMLKMDGIDVPDALLRNGKPEIEIIVVSAQSRRGGELTNLRKMNLLRPFSFPQPFGILLCESRSRKRTRPGCFKPGQVSGQRRLPDCRLNRIHRRALSCT